MSGKLTVPYRDRVSTVMSIKTFKIPAVIVPCIDRNWYGQFPTHTKTAPICIAHCTVPRENEIREGIPVIHHMHHLMLFLGIRHNDLADVNM